MSIHRPVNADVEPRPTKERAYQQKKGRGRPGHSQYYDVPERDGTRQSLARASGVPPLRLGQPDAVELESSGPILQRQVPQAYAC